MINREEYKYEINRVYSDSEMVRQELLKKYDGWTFIIVDTFDRTINVGRTIKRKGGYEKQYFVIYHHTLKHLINGELPPIYVKSPPTCEEFSHKFVK